MLLRELFLREDDRSTAVFAFGRFNPPTIGHKKLIDTVLQTAEKVNGKAYLFLSHKQNNKTDPLSFKEKQAYIQQYYPKVAVGDAGSNTIIKALQKIQAEGRTRIIMVAGSDRVQEFEKLLNQYNGKPDKAGNDLYKFDDIKVVNAGQRDPDADDVTGASASTIDFGGGPQVIQCPSEPYVSLLSSIFLHGGAMHLGGNMLFLWIFGDNIEQKFGKIKYLGIYLLWGILAGLIHIMGDATSAIPAVGASGAISGILGAYLVIFPRARIHAVRPDDRGDRRHRHAHQAPRLQLRQPDRDRGCLAVRSKRVRDGRIDVEHAAAVPAG